MDIHDYAERKRLSLRQIIDFTSGVNPLGPSAKAKGALRKAVKYLEFPPDNNIRYLKKYICKKEQINENNIIFGQGSSQILQNLIYTTKPNAMLLVSPVSKRYRKINEYHHVAIRTFPSDESNNFFIDISKLIEHTKDVDTVILPNPHDVTGTSVTADSLYSLIDAIEKNGKILIIDERYIDFSSAQSPVKIVTETQNTLILRTFSAFHALNGLPLGYGIGSTAMIKKLAGNFPLPQGNTLVYAAATTSLKDAGYRTRTLKFMKEEKKYFTDKLKQIDGIELLDTTCNFLLLKINKHIPDLENLFLTQHIIIDVFFCESTNAYLRIPIKRHKQNAKFLKTLKFILQTTKS